MKSKATLLSKDITAQGFGETTFLTRIEKHIIDDDIAASIDPHWHTYYELEFVIDGTGIHCLNNINMPLQRGACYLCLPTDFHTIKNTPGTDLILYNLKFNSKILNKEIADKIQDRRLELCCDISSEEDIKHFIALFEFMYHILSSKQQTHLRNELIIYTLNQIIAFFLNENELLASMERNTDFNESKLQQALFFIHQNFQKNISQEEIANHIGITTQHFSTIFFQKMNCNYSTYLTRLRLNYAKNLIKRKKSTNVTELCRTVGFFSTSYFIKKFKEEFGITPKQLIIESQVH